MVPGRAAHGNRFRSGRGGEEASFHAVDPPLRGQRRVELNAPMRETTGPTTPTVTGPARSVPPLVTILEPDVLAPRRTSRRLAGGGRSRGAHRPSLGRRSRARARRPRWCRPPHGRRHERARRRREPVAAGCPSPPARRGRRGPARPRGLPRGAGRGRDPRRTDRRAVAELPEGARLLASTAQARVHAWRCGSLLALQHHPEADPDRVAFWTARGAARRLGILEETSIAYGTPTADLSEPLRIAASAARSRAEAVEPVTTVFGRTLADSLVAAARIV